MAHHHHERDLYEVLGVAPTASPAEVTSAYRRRVRGLHPDSSDGATAEAGAGLADVLAAYHVLRDPDQRASYDAGRGQRAGRRPSVGAVRIRVRHIAPDPALPATTWLRAGPARLDPQPPPPQGTRPAPDAARQELPLDVLRLLRVLFERW